jgi:hypothetical protein
MTLALISVWRFEQESDKPHLSKTVLGLRRETLKNRPGEE